jgi:hypothetical protein
VRVMSTWDRLDDRVATDEKEPLTISVFVRVDETVMSDDCVTDWLPTACDRLSVSVYVTLPLVFESVGVGVGGGVVVLVSVKDMVSDMEPLVGVCSMDCVSEPVTEELADIESRVDVRASLVLRLAES